jgi:hypothetical protein
MTPQQYTITESDFRFVIAYFESVAVAVWGEDWDAPLTPAAQAMFRAQCANGAVQVVLKGWALCPVCVAMKLDEAPPGDNRCALCPLAWACWQEPDSYYNAIIGAIRDCDACLLFLVLCDAMNEIAEFVAEEVVPNGGSITITQTIGG